MLSSFEQSRIAQLTSSYGPDEPPRHALDFGDYLSLLWRIDIHAHDEGKRRYYQACAHALALGLDLCGHNIFRLVKSTEAGHIYEQLANIPYRGTHNLIDAQDRKAAICQLVQLRADILNIGTYQEHWPVTWPGSGIIDNELRERVFAVLFTALQGQFRDFGRLLLVADIVLSDLLLGNQRPNSEISLDKLIANYGYPNPTKTETRNLYWNINESDAV
ncbi:MAG: hypothetical protein D6737_03175 [Chloroflexi bacterium]|nr:MAG: hypothetical protein D6737_03175 [Chloroflexota bacterium]